MDIRAAGGAHNHDHDQHPATKTATPPANDVNSFNQAMQSDASDSASSSCCDKGGETSGGSAALDDPKTKEMLGQILNLVMQLLEKLGGESISKGGSTAAPEGGVNPVEGSGPGGSAGTGSSNELIPPPTEHIQELNLGGKKVTVGGDGTGASSAEEVAQTAQSIQNMYDNSPTFKGMIDNSSDPSFEVSVGKRGDNTSWGNTEGRVFMNTNNIAPGNSDSWQSLLTHEFAHASIDLGHGAEIERVEQQAAQEAA